MLIITAILMLLVIDILRMCSDTVRINKRQKDISLIKTINKLLTIVSCFTKIVVV